MSLRVLWLVAALVELSATHWLAFTYGRADVMENTAVVQTLMRSQAFGPYFGKCTPDFRFCAVDVRDAVVGIDVPVAPHADAP